MDESILEELEAFHGEVDRLVARLTGVHETRLRCTRGCSDCCIDGITVFEIEAERIRRAAAGILREAEPYPPGRCAFLSEDGACRIYPVRPFVCRTQGLPLRWIGQDDRGALAEMRDICEKNESGPPVEEIPRRDCWTLGPFEDRLAALQRRADGGRGKRIPLRTLFAGEADGDAAVGQGRASPPDALGQS
jgi:uncharacterized protein